jgi:hypothetical protein
VFLVKLADGKEGATSELMSVKATISQKEVNHG